MICFDEWLVKRDPRLAETLQQEAGVLNYLGGSRLGKWLALSPLYLSLASNAPVDQKNPSLLATPIVQAKDFMKINPGGKSRYLRNVNDRHSRRSTAQMHPTYNQPAPSLVLKPEEDPSNLDRVLPRVGIA